MRFFFYSFTYQLVVLPGMELNESLTPIVTIDTKAPPVLLNPDMLGGASAAGKIFTAGVRVKTAAVRISIL